MCQHRVSSALVVAILSASVAAQGGRAVSVTIEPPTAIEILLFLAGMDGKLLTTTNRSGKGSFDSSTLGNAGALTVAEQSCGERKSVLLVASNAKVPESRGCQAKVIGTFAAGKDTVLNAKLSSNIKEAIGAILIPEPAQPAAPPIAAQRGANSPQPQLVRPAATTNGARPCPPGTSMVGAKLDLQPDADSFEKAPLLLPCAYRGVEDTGPDKWIYYKVQIDKGQTLKVTARLRDSDLPNRPVLPNFGGYLERLTIRLHSTNGGVVGQNKSVSEPSQTCELEYKFEESGFAFVSMRWTVRDAALQIAVQ
jgi:hypothetical protein